jgi:hypothetical protein
MWLSSLKSLFFPKTPQKTPHYGRGIHALPNPKEHELFDLCAIAFRANTILSGYRYFLESIQHADNHDHLTINVHDDSITFTLYQGSAILHGLVTPEHLNVTAQIAKASQLHVAMKRRFLERNFQLTYCHFRQKEDIIELSIKLHNATITSQKIFFPLRELALNADYEKEFIASEFDESSLLEMNHIHLINPLRLRHLYDTMHEWIHTTKSSLVGLLSNDNKGMASCSYLALLLQIDYLLMPHKKIAKDINEKINTYFLEDEKLTTDKNSDLESYLAELETMSFETFLTQFYTATTTFSPFDHVMHDDIAEFIDESLIKVRWYKSNHANYVIPSIYRYIALYILFNYGVHPSLRALLHLHVQIYASDFFLHEGESKLYNNKTNIFDKKAIINAIQTALHAHHYSHRDIARRKRLTL